MNKYKKIFTLLMVTIIAILAAACSSPTKTDESKGTESSGDIINTMGEAGDGGSSPKGRFVEEEYELPEGIGEIKAVKKQTDGTIRMVTGEKVYNSNDGGKTWEEDTLIDLSPYYGDEYVIYSAGLDNEGRVVVFHQVEPEGDEYVLSFNTVFIEKDGTARNLSIQSDSQDGYVYLQNIDIITDTVILAKDIGENIILIDSASGDIKAQIPSDESYRYQVICAGEKLFVLTDTGVETYDMQGNLLEKDSVFNDLIAVDEDGNDFETYGFITPQENQEGVYYCDLNGLYHYTFGASMTENIINGTVNSIGDPSYTILGIIEKEDDSYLFFFQNSENNMVACNFYYSDDANVTPYKELKVYTLYDSQTIRQGIIKFNKKNSDIFVQYEVGIENDSNITESDALKTLNTNLMSGSGPDIIVMDGISIETFADKGLLTDISGIIDGVDASDGIFENIARALAVEDKVYAVPTRFTVPVLVGYENDISRITDTESLAEITAQLRGEDSEAKSVLGLFYEELLEAVYNISSPSWSKDGSTLDEGAIKSYLEAVGAIQNSEGKTEEEINEFKKTRGNAFSKILTLAEGGTKIEIGNVGNMFDLNTLVAVNEFCKNTYTAAAGQNVFIPSDIIALNSMSENTKEAERFLTEYLSSETQSVMLGEGFPVNKTAFENIYVNPDEGSEMALGIAGSDGDMMFSIPWISKEAFDVFRSNVETLVNYPLQDNIIKNAVMEEGLRYLKDEITLDDAYANIMNKIQIYLAE